MKRALLVSACALLSTTASAEQLFSQAEVGQTENAVITDDGRYFVGGTNGLLEITKQANGSLSKNLILATEINGTDCLLTGLTTDGVSLYGSCTVGVSNYAAPTNAQLFKVTVNGSNVTLNRYDYPTPVWYNGMAVDDQGNLYMSDSNAGAGKPVIVKTPLPQSANDTLVLQDWLIASGSEKLPNGIQIDGSTLYYTDGSKLLEIPINADGSAGTPTEKYKVTGYFALIDDFVITPQHIALAEVQQYSWGGTNQIVLVNKNDVAGAAGASSYFGGFNWCWWNCDTDPDEGPTPETIVTGSIRLSSLVYDKQGAVFKAGTLVGTSWFEGGLHQYDYDDRPIP